MSAFHIYNLYSTYRDADPSEIAQLWLFSTLFSPNPDPILLVPYESTPTINNFFSSVSSFSQVPDLDIVTLAMTTLALDIAGQLSNISDNVKKILEGPVVSQSQGPHITEDWFCQRFRV
jgi:hypothetical protein